MTQPLNAKGRPFSWSFSAVSDYETCPLQYAHKRFYCTVPFIETEPIKWGNRVHKAAENMLKRIPVHDEEALKPVLKYCEFMMRSGFGIDAELEIALTEDLKLTTWFAKDAWLRIKIDVVLRSFKLTDMKMFDWKTGKNIKDNPDQLKLSGAGLSVYYPQAETFDGKFVWTRHQDTTGIDPFTKKDIPLIWEYFLEKVRRMQDAWQTETFEPRRSGLCRSWCPVTSCQHCGQ